MSVFYSHRALEENHNIKFVFRCLLEHKTHVNEIYLQFVEENNICDHLELTTFLMIIVFCCFRAKVYVKKMHENVILIIWYSFG